jgi:hypothetical protein
MPPCDWACLSGAFCLNKQRKRPFSQTCHRPGLRTCLSSMYVCPLTVCRRSSLDRTQLATKIEAKGDPTSAPAPSTAPPPYPSPSERYPHAGSALNPTEEVGDSRSAWIGRPSSILLGSCTAQGGMVQRLVPQAQGLHAPPQGRGGGY